MPAYAPTIFIGAFLLFQVQPLMGKYILPWFGGGPGVWTTCMLFFQVVLLGGYGYAHFSSRCLKPRTQAIVHLILIAASLALLPITPDDSWKPQDSGNPTLQILVLLAACLGLPYFVLSATSPLMQHWFSRTHPGASPYRLYALSNVGSLLALASYPFLFETHFTRKAQAGLWAWGLVVYAVCSGICATRLWKKKRWEENCFSSDLNAQDAPRLSQKLLWLLLPACGSVLLLATTNKMCQDVAVVPFLWVLPLSLYLLSFIICFDSPRWYARVPFTLALIVAMAGICWALFEGTDVSIRKQIGVYSASLFICCMVCHGELYRLRPDPRHLTGFYLMIAAGGALGGLFVAVAAPLIFTDYYELHWGLLLCGLLFLLVCARDRKLGRLNQWRWLACILTLVAFGGLDWSLAWLGKQYPAIPRRLFMDLRIGMWGGLALLVAFWMLRKRFRSFQQWRVLACVWLLLGLLVLGTTLSAQARKSDGHTISKSRNFYGTLTVCEYRKNEPKGHYFLLQHGRITHGLQFVDPTQATWPTSYYYEGSGIALAVDALPANRRCIGVVGLGTGTMAAFDRAGDTLCIYEINPDVLQLATSRFTYLSNCLGKVEVVLGDARLSLEREPPRNFDLLALDAFNGDAIPVHLLTREAFEIYNRHLKTNGIIAVHISNHYLDLEPVVVNLARHFNYKLAAISYDEEESDEEAEGAWWAYSSTWILLTRSEEIITSPPISRAASAVKANAAKIPLWTDDFASLFQIVQ
jgi:SAM-dependent methyltransferase